MVLPFFADQYSWGRIVYKHNCGPQPLTIGQHSPESFLRGIRVLLSPITIRAAEKVASMLRDDEDGPMCAVESWERNLPIKKMLCQVSLASGETLLATKYCTECDLLLSDQAHDALHGEIGVPAHNVVPLYHAKEKSPLQFHISLRFQSVVRDTSFTILGNVLRNAYGPSAQQILHTLLDSYNPLNLLKHFRGLTYKTVPVLSSSCGIGFVNDHVELSMQETSNPIAYEDGILDWVSTENESPSSPLWTKEPLDSDINDDYSIKESIYCPQTSRVHENTDLLMKSAVIAKALLDKVKALTATGRSDYNSFPDAEVSMAADSGWLDDLGGETCISTKLACLHYDIIL